MATLVAFFHGQTTCLIPQNVDETLVLATSRIPECLKFLELCGLVGEQTLISEFEQLVANRVETICNLNVLKYPINYKNGGRCSSRPILIFVIYCLMR